MFFSFRSHQAENSNEETLTWKLPHSHVQHINEKKCNICKERAEKYYRSHSFPSVFGSWFGFWPIWKCWQGSPEHLLPFRQNASKQGQKKTVGYFVFGSLQLILLNLFNFNSNLLSSSFIRRRWNSVWSARDEVVSSKGVWGEGTC